MKRLWFVKLASKKASKVPEKGIYFSNKMKAKELRDELNSKAGSSLYIVTKGPDHKRFIDGKRNSL